MSVDGIKTNIALHQELMMDAISCMAAPAFTTFEHKLAAKGEVKK